MASMHTPTDMPTQAHTSMPMHYPTDMVAEPGSGPGVPQATAPGTNPIPQPPAFGPFNPGESSPGRWAVQVQYLGNFLNDLVTKLDGWAGSLATWKISSDARTTATEQEVVKIQNDLGTMTTVVESELKNVKQVVENEFGRKQQELELLAVQTNNSHAELATQTRAEVANFAKGCI